MTNKIKKITPIIIATIVLLILQIVIHYSPTREPDINISTQREEQPKTPKGNHITTDDLTTLTLDKKPFKITHYNNQNIIISFFSSTCPYCTQQTELFEKYRDELDYEVFYVPYKEEFDGGKDHILSLGLGVDNNRILEDPGHAFANQFNFQATPTNLFANQESPTVKGVVGLTSGEVHEKTDKEFLAYLFDLLKESQ